MEKHISNQHCPDGGTRGVYYKQSKSYWDKLFISCETQGLSVCMFTLCVCVFSPSSQFSSHTVDKGRLEILNRDPCDTAEVQSG